MADIPQYTIRPHTGRIVIPTIINTSILAILFYVGIVLNVSLLGIAMPRNIKFLIFVVLGLLVVIQALLTYVRISKARYAIYQNRIEIIGGKQPVYVMFTTVQNIASKRNFLDNLFKTGTISIDKIKLIGVPSFDQSFAYINQMVQYSRTQFNTQ